MLLVDGFHGSFLSLYIESSHFWIPPRQQLAFSLSVANGFLIESPQVVYLFVEVKRKWCVLDTDLHCAVVFFFLSFHSEQREAMSSVYKCHPLSLSGFHPTAPHPACCCIMLFSSDIYLTPCAPKSSKIHCHTTCTPTVVFGFQVLCCTFFIKTHRFVNT